jgi:hypothetical protein
LWHSLDLVGEDFLESETCIPGTGGRVRGLPGFGRATLLLSRCVGLDFTTKLFQ